MTLVTENNVKYIEAHMCRVIETNQRINVAIVNRAPAVVVDLLFFILGKLEARRGTGFTTAIRLDEFQATKTTGDCQAAWDMLDWPHTVSPPLTRR